MKKQSHGGEVASVVEGLEGRMLLAAQFDFVNTFGAKLVGDFGYSVVADNDGNTYLSATFRKTVNVNPQGKAKLLTSHGEKRDIVIAKYGPDGELIWAKQFGGRGDETARVIRLSPDGEHIYAAGVFQQTFTAGSGKNQTTLKSHGERDGFVMRLDTDGRFEWGGHIGGEFDDFVNTMEIGTDGDVYWSGTIRLEGKLNPGPGKQKNVETRGVDDTFVARLDGENGKLKWSKVFGEDDSRETVIGMSVDGNGNLFLAGTMRNEVQFDRGSDKFTVGGDEEGNSIYLARIKGNGDFSFVKRIDGGDYQRVFALASGPTGDVYLTGGFKGSVDFDPGKGKAVLKSTGEDDPTSAFVMRMSSKGDLVWAKKLGGGKASNNDDTDQNIRGTAIAVGADGSVYAAGDFQDVADFDPGKGEFLLNGEKNTSGDEDEDGPILIRHTTWQGNVFVSKLDEDGDFVDAVQFGSKKSAVIANSIVATDDGVVLTGAFVRTVDFDPGEGVVTRTTLPKQSRSPDVYVLKLVEENGG